MTRKKAVVLDTTDINGNGVKDLSLTIGERKVFTLYDVAYILAKFAGGALAAFTGCSLVGVIF